MELKIGIPTCYWEMVLPEGPMSAEADCFAALCDGEEKNPITEDLRKENYTPASVTNAIIEIAEETVRKIQARAAARRASLASKEPLTRKQLELDCHLEAIEKACANFLNLVPHCKNNRWRRKGRETLSAAAKYIGTLLNWPLPG